MIDRLAIEVDLLAKAGYVRIHVHCEDDNGDRYVSETRTTFCESGDLGRILSLVGDEWQHSGWVLVQAALGSALEDQARRNRARTSRRRT